MTEQTTLPSDAAINEALHQFDNSATVEHVKRYPGAYHGIIALACMIEKYEPECLVDPEVVAVREILADFYVHWGSQNAAEIYLSGKFDQTDRFQAALAKFREVAEVKRKGAGE